MIEQTGNEIQFFFKFTNGGGGATGLTAHCHIFKKRVKLSDTPARTLTELDSTNGKGVYYYTLPAADVDVAGDYLGCATAVGTCDQANVDAFWIVKGTLNLTELGAGGGLDDDLQGIRWQLRAALHDLKPDGTAGGKFSAPVLDAWLNMAYLETVFRTKCHRSQASITLVAGTSEYSTDPVFLVDELALSEKQLSRRDWPGISVEAWNNDPQGIPDEFAHKTGDTVLLHKIPSAAAAGVITTLAAAPTAAGTLYTVGDILTIVHTGASGGTAMVTSVSAGGLVTGVRLLTGGELYAAGTGKATTGGTGSACTLSITAVGVAKAHGFAYPTLLTNDSDIPTAIPKAHRISALIEGGLYFAYRSRRAQYTANEIESQLARWVEVCGKIAEAVKG